MTVLELEFQSICFLFPFRFTQGSIYSPLHGSVHAQYTHRRTYAATPTSSTWDRTHVYSDTAPDDFGWLQTVAHHLEHPAR